MYKCKSANCIYGRRLHEDKVRMHNSLDEELQHKLPTHALGSSLVIS